MIASRLTPFVQWLVDFYLLSTVMLLAGLALLQLFKQPSRRMAVAQSVAAGLAALAMFSTAPCWPRIAAFEWPTGDPAPWSPDRTPATIVVETAPARATAPNTIGATMGGSADVLAGARPARAKLAEPEKSLSHLSLPSWRSIVAIAFTSGAAINLAWLALGAIQAGRLRRSIRYATPRLEPLLARISADKEHAPRVGVSTRIGLPVAIGMVRPMIVLPESFVQSEPDDCLEAALAHEWAHIRNGDLRWLALLRVLNVLLFAQPLYWWLRREIRADQEALADAAAAALHGDGRMAYAETLVSWARSSHRQQSGALASAALALWERPSMLHRRVRLLLDPNNRVEPATSRRWKLATASMGLLAALLLSTVTLRQSAATAQVMKAPLGANIPSGAASQKTSVGGDRFEFAGRVVNPDGKPVIGAKMHLSYFGYHGQAPPAIRATSDAEGRFRIETRKADFVDTTYDTPWTTTQVVATAAGFGLGWADASKDEHSNTDPRNLTIRLAREDTAISGRLVDLEGRPVAGATIRPLEVLEPERGDLAPWIAASTSGPGGAFEIEREYLKGKLLPRGSGLPVAITTDANGRFAIQGVGGERLIRLKLSGPTIQTKEIGVLTRSTVPFRVTNGRGSPDWGIALYYGTNFTHAAAPTKPVIGIVTDKETGKPLAGVRIASDRTAEFPVYGFNGIETTTDDHGRYRLLGLPKGHGNQFIAIPAKGQTYLAARVEVPDSPGLDPVSLDIGLKRGIVIEGRVIDKTTGKPLKAYVAYNAYEDNPHLSEAPGFKHARVWGQYQTEPDGSFQVIGLPGRGLIAAMNIGGGMHYMTGTGLPNAISRIDHLPVVPDGSLGHFNTLSEVNPPNDVTTFHRDLALITGVTRIVRVTDPEGRPLAGARIKLQPRVTNLTLPQRTAEFQVEALGPDEIRPLIAFHDQMKLVGSVDVRANNDGITELKLVPWGTLIGRLVDEDGGARAKVDILYSERHDHPAVTDTQGRFRVEAIVPGKPAKVWVSLMGGFLSGTIAKAIVLKPGEIKDLGDVREAK